MSQPNSVTLWLHQLKGGEADAAEKLWERYFPRLVGFAQHKLSRSAKRDSDEEDIALSAFKSLCLGAQQGKFPKLQDREGLWPLLAVIISRKVCDQIYRERRLKRGGGNVKSAANLAHTGESLLSPLEAIAGHEPTPEFLAMMTEQCELLLNCLDDTCRQIALMKLAGHSNDEIVRALGIAPRTVERKLAVIRTAWEEKYP